MINSMKEGNMVELQNILRRDMFFWELIFGFKIMINLNLCGNAKCENHVQTENFYLQTKRQ